MNHDSGFIIGITDFFAKILIEHTPKTCLKKYPPTKTTLWWFFAINIGPIVSIKVKERSMSNCEKTEICHFVHIIIVHNHEPR